MHWFSCDFGCCCRYTVCSCSTLNLFLNVVTCTQSQAQSHSIEMKRKKEFGRFHKRHPFFLTNMSCDILSLIHKLEDELIAYKREKRHAIIFRTIFFLLFLQFIKIISINWIVMLDFVFRITQFLNLRLFSIQRFDNGIAADVLAHCVRWAINSFDFVLVLIRFILNDFCSVWYWRFLLSVHL